MREYRQKDAKTFHWVSFTYSGFIWVYTLPQKYETVVQVSVKLGIILTCKTECKGLFRSRKACKHHRTTLRELAKVKPRFFHLIYHPFVSIAHSCEINLRQLVATFNRLPVWKYVKRSWAPHILFFIYILPLNVLTFHFFFVTDNIHKWQRGDHLFPREQFFETVSYGPILKQRTQTLMMTHIQ